MSAGQADIYIEQGATFQMAVRLKDELGAPLDLTGQVFTGQIRKSAKDEIIWASMVFAPRNQMIDAEKGWVDITIPATSTALIPITKLTEGYYDFKSYQMAGRTYRWLEGKATISPAVAR